LATNAVADDLASDSVHGVLAAHTSHDLTADDARPIPADVTATDFAAHTTASIASAPTTSTKSSHPSKNILCFASTGVDTDVRFLKDVYGDITMAIRTSAASIECKTQVPTR